MQIQNTTVSLTVPDIAASATFFQEHLGYRQQLAADGFVSLTRDDAGVDVVLLRRGSEVLPEGHRDRLADGLVLAYTVADLDAELKRLQEEGVRITWPLRHEEWGERLFQITDPSGITIQLVTWDEGTGPTAWGSTA